MFKFNYKLIITFPKLLLIIKIKKYDNVLKIRNLS